MSAGLRYVLIVVIASTMIATLHAVLLEAMSGNRTFMALAAVFWISIIGGALILDRRARQ